ncbi:MAG TPA: hypothetical protein PKD20_02020 [Candidatus Saccharibacteria bacterium]|jgi:hypothetical protein|nr:hypothetical protein [Candidatus Saccharibacteria bacterium]HMT55636.1 hypothetical protein [Candidatus Saccharibacteria bacterium]
MVLRSQHQEILLFPGLGDDTTIQRQQRYISWLNKRRPIDAQIYMFNTKWQTQERFSDKLARAKEFVQSHPDTKIGYGISAGASLLMSLSAELPRNFHYYFISGKLRNPQTIGEEHRKRAPALFDSVIACEQSITSHTNKQHMRCYAGYLDRVLDQDDMQIPDVTFTRIPMVNHTLTIVSAYACILPRL